MMYKKPFKLIQVIKHNRYLSLFFLISLTVIFTGQKRDSNLALKGQLIGNWFYNSKDLSIKLQFNKNSGHIFYSPFNKRYNFQYSFKNDSIIRIWSSNEKPTLHLIRKLDSLNLQLRPYPIKKVRESIDLIDDVSFTRVVEYK